MTLASIYAEARGESGAVSPELAAWLADVIARARAAWPTVHVSDEEFVLHLADRPRAEEAHLADLYLACACGRGDRAALEAFESRVLAPAARALAVDPSALEDALQTAREDLLARGRVAQYDGRGPLKGFVRVAVLRLAVRASKKRSAALGEEELALVRAAGDDPELALAKLTVQSALRVAVAKAIDALGPDDALLLRQHLIDRLSIDDVARMRQVHRATAARWIVRVKETFLRELRRAYADAARASEDECESALRLIQSDFAVSVARLLSLRA